MKLYTYWRSSCSYRVRIVLGLKGLAWESAPVNLLKGEQRAEAYKNKNAAGLVPSLELKDGSVLTQSLAIINWLESTHPEPPILPDDPLRRARVLAAAHTIAMETQPISNLGVVEHLKSAYGANQQSGIDWMVHWMNVGFRAYQSLVASGTRFSFGDAPSLADVCLVPQLYNAHRWGVDLAPFSRLTEIENECLALPAFDAARPEAQPDAE